MPGLPSILSLFRNEFDKFNNTAAGMLHSVYQIALQLFKITFSMENVKILSSFRQRYNGRHYVRI